MAVELTLLEFDLERKRSTVIDVLPHSKFRDGHIPDAINLPVNEIEQRSGELLSDRTARLIVYCASPVCPFGSQAVTQLTKLGYTHVALFPGGLEEWQASGRELQRSQINSPPSDRVLALIDKLSIRQWVCLWGLAIIAFATLYWIGCLTSCPGLFHDRTPVTGDWRGYCECLYFSIVTATTVGYGDIVPVGWARILAATEAMGGMIVVGAIVSRLLSVQQERMLRDIHDLAFNERMGRMQMSLHLLISEFQDLQKLHSNEAMDHSRSKLRLSSGSTVLLRELRLVLELMNDPKCQTDEWSLELLFETMNSALQSYLDVVSLLKSSHSRTAEQLAQTVSEICSECMPASTNDALRSVIQRAELLARNIGNSSEAIVS